MYKIGVFGTCRISNYHFLDFTLDDGVLSFESKEKGRAEIDRVLGLFAKRKEEASLRQRAPGRAATMLTTKNKTQLTGY